MANDLLQRYIWLIDTISRHGQISRARLDQEWRNSKFSNGNPLPRRTFYNYRQAILELFNVEIDYDKTSFEYYIADHGDAHNEGVTRWLLNTAHTNELLTKSREVADKIFVEDVPSAREYLAPVIEALQHTLPICFNYHPYTRTIPSKGVVVEPYFVKIYRQRWYVTGRHVSANKVKTYALDRISDLTIGSEPFTPDPLFNAEDYFRYSFGIVESHSDPRTIALKVQSRLAPYFRALPLHHTQQESNHNGFSIFRYKMRISRDLVNEILSYGQLITVLEPRELREMVRSELEQALKGYDEN